MKLVVVIAALLTTRIATAAPTPTEPAPQISVGQVTGGLLLGGLVGIATGAAGIGIMEKMECEIDREESFEAFEGPCFRRSLYGFTIAGSIGMGLGFYAISLAVGGEKSAAITVGGAVIGAVSGAAIDTLLAATNDRKSTGIGTLIALTSPMIGAAVGYYFARSPRSTASASLLQLDRGKLALGMPVLTPTGEGVMLSVATGSF